MDGGAAAMDVLVQNLISVSKEEISLIRGVQKDAKNLKMTLKLMQSYLDDAGRKVISQDAVKTWLKDLEVVAFDADNVLDELNYRRLSKKVNTMQSEEEKVQSYCCFPSFNNYLRRREIAVAIREIDNRFKSINDKARELGLLSMLTDAPVAPDDGGSQTNSFTVDPIFIGRDSDVLEIVEMLTKCPTEQALSVLPIVGMGGIGKTTLTRNVFNHQSIETHFRERIWVHVPKILEPVELLQQILSTLTSQNVENKSSEVILKKLREALEIKTGEAPETKPYLLVLDNVWSINGLKWDDFINSISGISSKKGNGIIVTTRKMEVASIVNTLPIHELKSLPEENCWSIINSKIIGEGDVSPRFEAIGRKIAERCKGLPLAANVVGGVLRGKSEDDWLTIKDNWLGGHEDTISTILKLSFNHLSSPSLKKCFAYCSIFAKGEKIDKQQLIELWMAEGFLQPDQRSNMETVGNKIVAILLQNSLLQVERKDEYANITHCGMHDLVHDLASSVLGRAYYRHESDAVSKEDAKCLRTLFYNSKSSDFILSNFRSLHALTLRDYHAEESRDSIEEDDHVEELPDSINELIHLRYLDISCRGIQSIPNTVGELYNLQTLRAQGGKFQLTKLPCTLKYLINLRHLHVPFRTKLPPHLGMLTSLQTLEYFEVGDEDGHRIVELGSLNNLKGKLVLKNLEKIEGEEEAKKAYLFRKPNIVELALWWDGSREGEVNDENVLEGLQPHPNLKTLKINGFKGRRFPLWSSNMAVRDSPSDHWRQLDNLMKIKLSNCSTCEEIPTMGYLPHLKSLSISGLENVRCIGSSFYGIDNVVLEETIDVFPALEVLLLRNMSNLIEWEGVEIPTSQVKVFPCLKYLEIWNCEKLRRAPSQLACLETLNIWTMVSPLSLANICGIKLASLTQLKIFDINKLVSLPDLLFYNIQNLRELIIEKCENLRELPNGLHTLNSLEDFYIAYCRSLEIIPYYPPPSGSGSCSDVGGQSQGGLTSLRKLSIKFCDKLMNLPYEMVESCALSLKDLCIFECPNLKSIAYHCPSSSGSSGGRQLPCFKSLRRLTIVSCEALTDLPCEMVCAPLLESLNIYTCSSLKSIPFHCSSSQGFKSLRRLRIRYCGALVNLPYEMVESCAPSLELLELWDISSITNLEEIGGCLHKMARLRYLYICNFPKWTISSSMEPGSLRSLQKLTMSVADSDSLGRILQAASQSLRKLYLTWKEDCYSLPDQLQHLTVLERLTLNDLSRIEELPEWFGNFTSLQYLRLRSCQRLTRLPSVETMQRLSNLTELSVEDCPILEERCLKLQTDAHHFEWPKISHISRITFDYAAIRWQGWTMESYQYLDDAMTTMT